MNIWLVAALASIWASPAFGGQADPDLHEEGISIELGQTFSIDSDVMEDTRQINVWLPPDYASSGTRYPVVYLLDGGLAQDFIHIAGLGSLASLSWTFGPMIIVGVETKDRRSELTPPATDARYLGEFSKSGGAERFRKMLREEVIPFLEGAFRTGERRAIMGESLAGLFVVDTLLVEPELFDDYVAISPSLWWDDRRALRSLDAQPIFREVEGRRFYLSMANEGGTMQHGADLLRAGIRTLPREKLDVRYVDRSSDASHSTIYHSAAEDALRWLYPAPAYELGPTPWYMIEGASPSLSD